MLKALEERNNYRRELIRLVKENPILWNKAFNEFSDRNEKLAVWKNIAVLLQVPRDKVRRTWENLRDQYRRDYKRYLHTGVAPKWHFYRAMHFIQPMVRIQTDHSIGVGVGTSRPPPPALKYETTDDDECSLPPPTQFLSAEYRHQTDDVNDEQHIEDNRTIEENRNLRRSKRAIGQSEMELDKSEAETVRTEAETTDRIEHTSIAAASQSPPAAAPVDLINFCDVKFEVCSDADSSLATAATSIVPAVSTTPRSVVKHTRRHRQQLQQTPLARPIKQEQQEPTFGASSLCLPEANDEDYHFVMSLLPSLRRISCPSRRLRLRMHLLNTISEALNEEANTKEA